ncbi:nucleotidyltransferase family protein [Pontibacter anaerobius]|uniref:glucose-1-phosphate thymidylyltransferase n=1 Tax=Pontibacter anaerobius TaxID=2993940 RepID=A0ABT3RIH5_9BACT|nr:sugar phosphate nucleotidyltransferase [Pontibacter anaerobius]MCX2741148.1 sugar phosphate nucleotidyltransferase [Pontibacter anaerobius]
MMATNVVGLIPAAGLGSRLSPIPCSKELFPVGFEPHPEHGEPHPKVVSQYLLEHMQRAGARQVYVILRKGKWDIPDYYGDGSQLGLQLAYLIMQRPYGSPYTLDQAYTFVRQQRVVFGFPDILFEPQNAFEQLLQKQEKTQADVVLGCFKVPNPQKWDMVELEENGEVKTIFPKPATSNLAYGWAIACWGPRFTEFMHSFLKGEEARLHTSGKEFSVGEVVQAAIHHGLLVLSVSFDEGSCLDVGTPEDLQKAIRTLS